MFASNGNNPPLLPHEWVVTAAVSMRGPLLFSVCLFCMVWHSALILIFPTYTVCGKGTLHWLQWQNLHLLQTLKRTKRTDKTASHWTEDLERYPVAGEDRANHCMDNREMPGYLHHYASSTSQHVLCIQEIMTYHRPHLYAPLSQLLCCMSPKSLMTRASLSVWTLMMDAHGDEGKTQLNLFTLTKHTQMHNQT